MASDKQNQNNAKPQGGRHAAQGRTTQFNIPTYSQAAQRAQASGEHANAASAQQRPGAGQHAQAGQARANSSRMQQRAAQASQHLQQTTQQVNARVAQTLHQQEPESEGQQVFAQQTAQASFKPAGASYQQRATRAAHSRTQRATGSDFDEDMQAYAPEADNGLRRVRKKRMSKGKKIAIGVFAVLFVLIVGSGVALAAWVSSLNSSMGFEDKQAEAELKEALQPATENESAATNSNAFYMLILGSDSRDSGESASRSDVNMLCRIDPDTGKVTLVSIPRDMMITIDGQGTQKINAAYSFGGAAGAVNAVSTFAGVPITHYAEVHFEELESVVDQLGGIWVNVPEGFSSGNGGVSLSEGYQLLNGEQALAFARERYNVSGGDFSRAQAQRIIVKAIIQQVLASSPTEMPGLISQLAESVSTDMSITDLVGLAQKFQSNGLTMYSAVCPSYSLTQDGVSYVCPMFDEWRTMMCRVDAGLDPNDETAEIPQAQQANTKLGAATNSPATHSYASLVDIAGLTTDDVVKEE